MMVIGLKHLLKYSLLMALLGMIFPVSVFAETANAHGEEAGSEDHAASGESHDVHGTKPINWFDFSQETPPLVATFFNFALLLVVLYFLLRKSLTKRFADRKADFEKSYNEAGELKAEAEKTLAEAKARLDGIDAEMAQLKKEIIETGKAKSAHIVEEASKRSERMRADAKSMVEQEIAQVVQLLREELSDEIVAEAGKILKEKMNEGDHERLTKEYLAEIGVGANSASEGTS
jgi:F-type H+-transporting ATPase subunit b